MVKRRTKAPKAQEVADAAETGSKKDAASEGKKSPEPKAKKSRLCKAAQVIHIDCSPEKKSPKPTRSSRLSRSTPQDQKKKIDNTEKQKNDSQEKRKNPSQEKKSTSAAVHLVPDTSKTAKVSNKQKQELQNEVAQEKKKEIEKAAVTFDSRETFYSSEYSPIQHDLPMCSQSVESQCDVIWQSSSPISFTQAAKVTSRKSTDTADLIKKFSHNNADPDHPGSPILKTSSTPPLLGLWSSASKNKVTARRMWGPGRGVKRPSGAGNTVSSEDIIMKLNLVLESKSESEEMEETVHSKNPEDHVRSDSEAAQSEQIAPESRHGESPEKGASSPVKGKGISSPAKEQNDSLDLFSEGFMSQPKSPGVDRTVEDVPGTSVKTDAKVDVPKDGNTLHHQEKSVSQGFQVSTVGNSASVVHSKKAVAKTDEQKTIGDDESKTEKEKEKASNESCEDLWTDDDMEDDSFVMKATQDLFDSEAFHTPKPVKSLSKTSTPVATKKGGRLTFSLNPVVTKTVTVSSAAVIAASAGSAKTSVMSSSMKTVDSNELSKTRQTTTFKKPLPAPVVSPSHTAVANSGVPFQSYGTNKNSSNDSGPKVSLSNNLPPGMKRLPPPVPQNSPAVSVPLGKPILTGPPGKLSNIGLQSKSVLTGHSTKPGVTGSKQTAVMGLHSKPVITGPKSAPMVTAGVHGKPAGTGLISKPNGPLIKPVNAGISVVPQSKSTVINKMNTSVNSNITKGSLISQGNSNVNAKMIQNTKPLSNPNARTVAVNNMQKISVSNAKDRQCSNAAATPTPLNSGAIPQKSPAFDPLSSFSEEEIMDTSLGDDLLLSLAEPDDQLDSEMEVEQTFNGHKDSISMKGQFVPKKLNTGPSSKGPVPTRMNSNHQIPPPAKTTNNGPSHPNKIPNSMKTTIPNTNRSSANTTPSGGNTAHKLLPPAKHIQTNRKNSGKTSAVQKPTERPAENDWDEDEDDDLLLMTSQAVESGLKSNTNVKSAPITPPPVQNSLNSKPVAATKVKPACLNVTNNSSKSNSFVFNKPETKPQVVIPVSCATNSQRSSKSGFVFSRATPSMQMSQTSSIANKPAVSSALTKSHSSSAINKPAVSNALTKSHSSSAINKPHLSVVPVKSSPNNLGINVKPLSNQPTKSLAQTPATIASKSPYNSVVPSNVSNASAAASEKQEKDAAIEDDFQADDDMLCEDQVLAMLDDIESQQISQRAAGTSMILCSTQKTIPGPTQMPQSRTIRPFVNTKPSASIPSATHGGTTNPFQSHKSKAPLAPVSTNPMVQPPKGTPPVPDISPIKLNSQPEALLGSSINIAIVDKNYPKCSPDEIERKKAEAKKRRLMKKK